MEMLRRSECSGWSEGIPLFHILNIFQIVYEGAVRKTLKQQKNRSIARGVTVENVVDALKYFAKAHHNIAFYFTLILSRNSRLLSVYVK